MAKRFTIKPLADLHNSEFPMRADIDLPEGASVECQQYSNHVYLLIHYTPQYTHTHKREIFMAVEGEDIPSNYEYIGGIIANDAGPSDEELANEEAGEDEESEFIDVPRDPEQFYKLLTMINVYISPEKRKVLDSKSWSFLGANDAT